MRASLLSAWVLRFVLVVTFFFFAYQHTFDPGYAAQFALWGYPSSWHTVTAIIEVAGAVLLLIPQTTLVGVGVLSAVLVAGTLTLLFAQAGAAVLIPVTVLVAVVVLGWLRWSERV